MVRKAGNNGFEAYIQLCLMYGTSDQEGSTGLFVQIMTYKFGSKIEDVEDRLNEFLELVRRYDLANGTGSHDCHSYLHITLTLPKFQTDYMFIRTVAESKTQPCITFVETRSGVVLSFMCARKGGCVDLTKEMLRHF